MNGPTRGVFAGASGVGGFFLTITSVVFLALPAGCNGGSGATASGPPTRIVSFSGDAGHIVENGGVARITLRLDQPVRASALSFPYTIEGIQAEDITGELAGHILVPAGRSTGTLAIVGMPDDIDEGDGEMIRIILGDPPRNSDNTPITAPGIGFVGIALVSGDVASFTVTPNPINLPLYASISDVFPSTSVTLEVKLKHGLPGRDMLNIEFISIPEYSYACAAAFYSASGCDESFDRNYIEFRQGQTTSSVTYRMAALRSDGFNDGYLPPSAIEFILYIPGHLGGGDRRVRVPVTTSPQGGALARMSDQAESLSLGSARAQVAALGVRDRLNAPAPSSESNIAFSGPGAGEEGDADDFMDQLSFEAWTSPNSGTQTHFWGERINDSLSDDFGALSLSEESVMDGARFGLEWSSHEGRHRTGVALSTGSTELSLSGADAGLSRWSESMTIIAPYLTRRSDSASLWAGAGIGTGTVSPGADDSGGSGAASQLAFLQAGTAWSTVFSFGPTLALETEGSFIRKDVSGFRLSGLDIPAISATAARLDGGASMDWSLPLAGGVMSPRMGLDLSYDAADLLPGESRRAVGMETGLRWSRDAFSIFSETSRALSRTDTASEEVSAGMRLELWEDIGLDLETARELVNDEGVSTHRARIGGRWAF